MQFAASASVSFDTEQPGGLKVKLGDLKPYGDGRARRFAWRPELGPTVRHLKEFDLI
jgi:hypothetical protein